jgi:hypothetical protein
LRETVLVPNTSTSVQKTSAAEEHLAEGQFLLEKKTLNTEISLIYRAPSQRATVPKTEGISKPR